MKFMETSLNSITGIADQGVPMPKITALKIKQVIELLPKAPFNFDATMHKPDHFPTADNAWQPGVRWQTMLWRAQALGLKFKNRGTVEQPKVSLAIWSENELDSKFLTELTGEINYRYNLQLDLTKFNQRFESDPQLSPVINKWRGMRPMNCNSLYE